MYIDDCQYGNLVPHNWSYEEEMSEREESGIENRCPIMGNPDYAGRVCPANGIDKCKDCPFV